MTYEELRKQCVALQRECNDKQEQLKQQYALEHNPAKVGDIITDHYHTIRVENMKVTGHPVPYMRYSGIELTKQGEPKKRQPVPRNPVHQCNLQIVNGKPYTFNENGD